MPGCFAIRLVLWLALGVLLVVPEAVPAQPATLDPALLGGLRWRTIGPDGNRLSAAAGEWGNPDEQLPPFWRALAEARAGDGGPD